MVDYSPHKYVLWLTSRFNIVTDFIIVQAGASYLF